MEKTVLDSRKHPWSLLQFSLLFHSLPKNLEEELTYNLHSNPVSIALNNSFELFSYNKENVSKTLYDNELSHGRLAMLTCAHIIAKELLTQKGLFI